MTDKQEITIVFFAYLCVQLHIDDADCADECSIIIVSFIVCVFIVIFSRLISSNIRLE
jgi:hypothetical protein